MGSKSIKMKTIITVIPAIFLLLFSCNPETQKGSVEQWKQEILDTEKEFALMAADVGIPEAFIHYAAEDAVLMRNNRLVTGKDELIAFYEKQAGNDYGSSLSWEPDFVDVSGSGDLGYTYGSYTFSYIDSTGSRTESRGIFHTVWKRQVDGTWRYVWD